MADIFVSYATNDRKWVRLLVETLEEDGFSVWWDRSMHAGTTYDREIETAISESVCMVVVWSADSVESEYVRSEVEEGARRNILVPVLIDEDVLPPLAHRRKQAANLALWSGERDAEYHSLLAGIRVAIDGIDPSETGISPVLSPQSPQSAGSSSIQRRSVVVLPFDNLSPDPGDAYFSDGLTEEIVTNLANIHSLRVISRSTAMALKDSQKDVRSISRELGVEYVLEGSVRKAGESLRISAKLIDAKSDEHIWTTQHDGTMGDVFSVQEQIAKLVVNALKLELSPTEERLLVDRPINDLKAYETWVLARHEARKFSAQGSQRAIQLAEQILEITGDNAQVYAFLGFLYWQAYDFGNAYTADTLDHAEGYASKALALDPDSSQALLAKGLVQYKRGDIATFVRFATPAAELNNDSGALVTLAFVLAEVGELERARVYADHAVVAGPLEFLPRFAQSTVDLFEGNSETALTRIRDARDRFAPGGAFAGWWVAQMAAYAGEEAEAHRECSALASMDDEIFIAELCELLRRALDRDREGVIEQSNTPTLNERSKTDELYPLFIANTLAIVGEYNAALDWLEHSINWGFSNHRFLSEYNRFLEPLREDRRFHTLMNQAREKQEGFKA